MVAEESAQIAAMLEKETVELLFKVLFRFIEKDRYPYGSSGSYMKENKKPKVNIGELSGGKYEKLLRSGEKFRMTEVPAEKLGEIETYAKQLGASYYVLENGSSSAVIAVSEKSFEQFSDAIKQTAKAQLAADKNSVEIMDENNIIPAEQVNLARELLSNHDIPVFSFKDKDGGCINVVSNEYSGQYKAVIQELNEAMKSVENVKISAYIQSADGNSKVKEISEEQARSLSKEFGQDKINFYKNDGKIFVKYPAEMKTEIENNFAETAEKSTALKKYGIAAVQNAKDHVTVDKEKLKVTDKGDRLFMRIPNTDGQEYIMLPKKEAVEINGGKTVKFSIDNERQYDVLDADGNVQRSISGAELAKYYEVRTEKIFGNDDSQTVHYDISGGERIEIYDKANDKIISVGVGSADKLNAILLENGIDGIEAAAIIEKAHDTLGINKSEEIHYSDENIAEDIKRSEAEEKVENMELFGEKSGTAGEKCTVYDEQNNKYTVIDIEKENKETVKKTLIAMGYTEIQAAAVMSKLSTICEKENINFPDGKAEEKVFNTSNAELNNYRYSVSDNGDIAIIKPEINADREASVKYVTVKKGASRGEIESKIRNGFAEDEKTVTDIMTCFDNEKLIPVPEQIVIPSRGYKVQLTTSQTYEISKNGVSVTVQRGNTDIQKTAEALGISEKEASSITSKIEKTMNFSDRKPSFLSQLKQATVKTAADKDEKGKDTREKTDRADKSVSAEGR